MSVRRDTTNRLTLYRECAICGRPIVTTAATPWMRMVEEQQDGKRCQRIKYYCSSACKAASYKHRFDGKAQERKAAREQTRDVREKNRRYYIAHREQEKERQRARYWADVEASRATQRYNRQKRRALGLEG